MSKEEAAVFQCPRCQKFAGHRDRFASHERDQIKVIVRCNECRHRWSVILPVTSADNQAT